MGESEFQNQSVALLGCRVTYTVDGHFLLEAVGYTDNHVVNQSSSQTVLRSVSSVIGRSNNGQYAVFDFDFQIRVYAVLQLALRTFYFYQIIIVYRYFYAGRDSNRSNTNS